MDAPSFSRQVLIVAPGPSVSDAEIRSAALLARSRGYSVLAVSNAAFACLPDAVYACDYKWWLAYRNALIATGYDGLCMTQDAHWPPGQAEAWGLFQYRTQPARGFSAEAGTLHPGGHSGHQAINAVLLGGSKRIVLFGFTGARHNGKSHSFGDHTAEGLWNGAHPAIWFASMREGIKTLSLFGAELILATPQSIYEPLLGYCPIGEAL